VRQSFRWLVQEQCAATLRIRNKFEPISPDIRIPRQEKRQVRLDFPNYFQIIADKSAEIT
jgi:hypothetical protein